MSLNTPPYSIPFSLGLHTLPLRVTWPGLPTSGADEFIREEVRATYIHTCPINGNSTTLTSPTMGIHNGPAHEAGQKRWHVKGPQVIPYSKSWNVNGAHRTLLPELAINYISKWVQYLRMNVSTFKGKKIDIFTIMSADDIIFMHKHQINSKNSTQEGPSVRFGRISTFYFICAVKNLCGHRPSTSICWSLLKTRSLTKCCELVADPHELVENTLFDWTDRWKAGLDSQVLTLVYIGGISVSLSLSTF